MLIEDNAERPGDKIYAGAFCVNISIIDILSRRTFEFYAGKQGDGENKVIQRKGLPENAKILYIRSMI